MSIKSLLAPGLLLAMTSQMAVCEPEGGDGATPDPTGTPAEATPTDYEGHTVGVLQQADGAEEGYTLFHPMTGTTTYLIDLEGRLVHSWAGSYSPGLSVYLLDDGRLLRTGNTNVRGQPPATLDAGGAGGYVELVSWDGQISWSYTYSNDEHRQHHDVEMLPNGHVVLIAWEARTQPEALAAGRDPQLLSDGALWPDHLVEIDPDTSEIVWSWHVWDHLVQDYDPSAPNYGDPKNNPGRIDLNYASGQGVADWTHINAVDYDEANDQLLLSVHNFSEVWVIDHSTTAEEAATSSGGRQGRGGDLLYRWGNPAAWGAGDASDRILYAQHDAEWIPAGYPGEGDILVFNNGQAQAGRDWSSVDQLTPPLGEDGSWPAAGGAPFGPAALTWSWTADNPPDLFASNISGAQRLPGGGTLVTDGPSGTFYEVTEGGDVVWTYVNPVAQGGVVSQGEEVPINDRGDHTNTVFRADRYAPDHPAFTGRDLSAGGTLEGP